MKTTTGSLTARKTTAWLPLALAVCLALPAALPGQIFTPGGQRLRALGDLNDFWIGTSIGSYGFTKGDSADYLGTAGAEYNLMTPEDGFKFAPVEPAQNSFSFTAGDQIVAYALSKGADVHGHNLLWYYGNPSWLVNGTWTAATLTGVMDNHIDNVVGHWAGQVRMWDVVNEAIDGSKSSTDWKQNLRSNDIWNSIIGPSYIELAFQRAHAADPAALLIYNDYDQEQVNTKSDTMYAMMSDFLARGIPVDGVGFQCHWFANTPDYDSLAANFDRFARLGLMLFITEFDTDNPNGSLANVPNASNDLQARIYYNCLDKFLRCPAAAGFQCWGVDDKYSWRGYANYPLPFDSYYLGYEAKPAYYGLQDALAVQFRSPLVTNPGFESGAGSWTNNGTGTLSIVTGAHSGASAVKITGRSGAWGGPTQDVTARLLAQGAGRYYLSGWMKADSGSIPGRLMLQLTDSAGVHYLSVDQTAGTSWTQIAGWVNVTWFKTLSNARLIMQTASGTADFYADDLQAGDGNIAGNGNFEDGLTGWTGWNGATIASTTSAPQYHYGAKGVGCTGRAYTTQAPKQDILAALLAQGPGTYTFQGYMKLAAGGGTGKIGLLLTYGGTDHYLTGATGTLNATGWTKVASAAGGVSVTWSAPLTGAYLYLETPGTVSDFYADEIVMRK